ncbi:hypothetical protein B5X24_HaOG216054, partial [Helicoverpa armigera]
TGTRRIRYAFSGTELARLLEQEDCGAISRGQQQQERQGQRGGGARHPRVPNAYTWQHHAAAPRGRAARAITGSLRRYQGDRARFMMANEKPTSTAQAQASSLTLQPAEDENTKSCWVCFATEADDRLAAWVQPCKCIGTTKWVHQSCLQRWVDEKQRGNITRKVLCPQCKAEYIVVFPSMGAFVALLDAMEDITHKICPFIAGGVLLGSIYWIAITYGAVTVMQVRLVLSVISFRFLDTHTYRYQYLHKHIFM